MGIKYACKLLTEKKQYNYCNEALTLCELPRMWFQSWGKWHGGIDHF